MEQVIVNIDADGKVQVEAQGVRGQGCAALTRAIEQAIGTTTGDVKKTEFYQKHEAVNRVRSGSGH